MNVSRPDNFQSDLLRSKKNSNINMNKKEKKSDEFRKIMEKTVSDQNEEWEELRILMPKHGHFWDNGYEDLD